MNNEKIIGVLGGMGPLADSEYLRLLTLYTQGDLDRDKIHIIMDSNPKIPDRSSFLSNISKQSPLPLMLRSLKLLESCGADFIAIPCNTAHCFFHELQAETRLRIINMLSETCLACKKTGAKSAAILATDGTISSGIYQNYLRNLDIIPVIPEDGIQRKIHSLIYEVKAGLITDGKLTDIAKSMQKKCDILISGCTELSVLLHCFNSEFPFIDSLSALVKGSILLAGKNCKNIPYC